jgi:hypothetical protein
MNIIYLIIVSLLNLFNLDCFIDLNKVENNLNVEKALHGFIEHTLIKRLNDNDIYIEDLKIGDLIFGFDKNNFPQMVIDIQKILVEDYFCLVTNENFLYTLSDQLFYSLDREKWIKASDLICGEKIKTGLKNEEYQIIEEIEPVFQEAFFYSLTTTNHMFFLSDGIILTHNFLPAIPILTIALDFLFLLHPIIKILKDETIDLESLSDKFINSIKIKTKSIQDIKEIEQIKFDGLKSFYEFETTYFIERKNKLIEIYTNFLKIKNDLNFIYHVSKKKLRLFSEINIPGLYKKYDDWFILSTNLDKYDYIFTELALSQLSQKRKYELAVIEKNIIDIQFDIALYVESFINSLNDSVMRFKNITKELDIVIPGLNKYVDNSIQYCTYEKGIDCPVFRMYEILIKGITYIEYIEYNINHLTEIKNYCNKLSIDNPFKLTTNIIELIKQIEKDIKRINEEIQHVKKIIISSIQQGENHLKNKLNMNSVCSSVQGNTKREILKIQKDTLNFFLSKQLKRNKDFAIGKSSPDIDEREKCLCGCPEILECKCHILNETKKCCSCLEDIRCYNNKKKCSCQCIHAKVMLKTEFFNQPVIKNNYRQEIGNIYKLRDRGKEVVPKAYYLKWDKTHSDVEVWNKNEIHLGSLNPRLNKLYKDPDQKKNDQVFKQVE